jgi:hypothetical protein
VRVPIGTLMSVARRSHRALKRLRGEEHLLSFFSDFEPAIRIAAGERLLERDRQRSAGQWSLELDRSLRDHPEPELSEFSASFQGMASTRGDNR